MKVLNLLSLSILLLGSCSTAPKTTKAGLSEPAKTDTLTNRAANRASSPIEITPISHATMVLQWDNTVIYIDPIGGEEAFKGQPGADMILVTDIHEDHFNSETVADEMEANTRLIVPQAVADKLPEELRKAANILANGEEMSVEGIAIIAIPMYNLRKEALKYHPKGRGNGYVLEKDGKRVYISGDTEGIPEMRNLKDIDIAFVCMNLPYTMSVEDAADAVLAFKPKKVYPYHYRGKDGLSDVAKFKELVNARDSDIEVVQLDWYPKIP